MFNFSSRSKKKMGPFSKSPCLSTNNRPPQEQKSHVHHYKKNVCTRMYAACPPPPPTHTRTSWRQLQISCCLLGPLVNLCLILLIGRFHYVRRFQAVSYGGFLKTDFFIRNYCRGLYVLSLNPPVFYTPRSRTELGSLVSEHLRFFGERYLWIGPLFLSLEASFDFLRCWHFRRKENKKKRDYFTVLYRRFIRKSITNSPIAVRIPRPNIKRSRPQRERESQGSRSPC